MYAAQNLEGKCERCGRGGNVVCVRALTLCSICAFDVRDEELRRSFITAFHNLRISKGAVR